MIKSCHIKHGLTLFSQKQLKLMFVACKFSTLKYEIVAS